MRLNRAHAKRGMTSPIRDSRCQKKWQKIKTHHEPVSPFSPAGRDYCVSVS